MKQKIYEVANDMGYEMFGITSIIDYDSLRSILNSRINNNYYNELQEQNIEKRLNAKNVFPECKSIIAVGFSYAKGYKIINSKNKGLISLISFGEDYHHIVNESLKEFGKRLEKYFSFKYKICVDTSPLIDKEICRRAGIGNYGKNSLLINEDFGSFIYLGYLLTDLDIVEKGNDKYIDICKDCDICIKLCPNNAILKNGKVNTKRCISYLTQTKNYIPIEYRKNMGNHIYGCDVCQLVCPKNQKTLTTESSSNYKKLLVDLKELLSISNSQFADKYGNTSGGWRGKNIWKRNAIISITNLDLKYMFDLVKEELKNQSNMIKIYSAWSMMILNKQKASDILYSNLKYEKDIVMYEYKKLLEEEL
nr:tRNA epoxyqueuosine(34) reductase QueG [Sedimentibacter sp.]